LPKSVIFVLFLLRLLAYLDKIKRHTLPLVFFEELAEHRGSQVSRKTSST